MYSGFGAHGWICVSLCGRLVLFIGKATTILGEFGRVFLAVKKTSSFQLRLREKLTKVILINKIRYWLLKTMLKYHFSCG